MEHQPTVEIFCIQPVMKMVRRQSVHGRWAADEYFAVKQQKPTSEPPFHLPPLYLSLSVFSTTSPLHTPQHQLKYSSQQPPLDELSSAGFGLPIPGWHIHKITHIISGYECVFKN